MGPRPGFGTCVRPIAGHITVSELYKGKNLLLDAMIYVHAQVARCAVELDRDRDGGLKMVAAGFRDSIMDITARGIGVMCVFDGAKLPGKIANYSSRAVRVTRYRVMLESLLSAQLEQVMTDQERKDTEKRYLNQCTMVQEDMILAVMNELERVGLKWRRAQYEADSEMAYLMTDGPGVSLYSAVISADLDLVVHGVQALLTSYDAKNDSAFVYDTSKFASYDQNDGSEPFMEAVSHMLKDSKWTLKDILSSITYACMVGCDYIQNVKNIGHNRACKLLLTVKAPGPEALFDALQCHDKLELRQQHLLELRKAFHS